MSARTIILTTSFLLVQLISLSQNHRVDRYDGPTDGSFGLKAIGFGALIWLIGMIILKSHKSDENGAVKDSNAPTAIFGVTLAVIGGLTFLFGLIALGF